MLAAPPVERLGVLVRALGAVEVVAGFDGLLTGLEVVVFAAPDVTVPPPVWADAVRQ